MDRVFSELLWALRRSGIEISTSAAIDAARAAEAVGLEDRGTFYAAIAATVVKRREDLPRFRRAFDDFFDADAAHPSDLFGRLRARGVDDVGLDALRQLLTALGQRSGAEAELRVLASLAGHPGEIDYLLRGAGVKRVLRHAHGGATRGFFVERVAHELGVSRAASAVGRLGDALRDAVGAERAALAEAALREELEHVRARIGRLIDEGAALDAGVGGDRPRDAPFSSLDEAGAADVRRALRTLAARLEGGARARQRTATRGRVDTRRTLRAAARTLGVPVTLVHRRRRKDRPKLIVVCDVSDSVRPAAAFLLELLASMSELFAGTRTFVFTNEVGETTHLFRRLPRDRALAEIASGAVVAISSSSNYGRALRDLERRVARRLDRRTTVVIVGDGRTNLHGDGADVVRRLRDRSRGVLWLCPEPRATWGQSDSAMPRYVQASTEVVTVRSGRELEDAARRLLRFRA